MCIRDSIYIVIAGAATYRVWDTRAYLRFCHGRTDFRRIFLGSAYHKSLQMAVVLGYSYGTAGRKRIELSEIHSPPSPSTADRLPVCPAPRVYRRWWSLIVSDHPRAEETNQTERLINYFGRRRGERRSCFTGRVEQSVGCLSVCLSVCLSGRWPSMSVDIVIWHCGSPWPYLGQICRSRSQIRIQGDRRKMSIFD